MSPVFVSFLSLYKPLKWVCVRVGMSVFCDFIPVLNCGWTSTLEHARLWTACSFLSSQSTVWDPPGSSVAHASVCVYTVEVHAVFPVFTVSVMCFSLSNVRSHRDDVLWFFSSLLVGMFEALMQCVIYQLWEDTYDSLLLLKIVSGTFHVWNREQTKACNYFLFNKDYIKHFIYKIHQHQ